MPVMLVRSAHRNHRRRLSLLVAAALAMTVSAIAEGVEPPTEIGGGGARSSDCLATFKANATSPAGRPRRVRCVDGDPACDSDATVDGFCNFEVAVCANSSFDSTCTSPGVESVFVLHSLDDGHDPEFQPDLQALQSRVESDIEPPTTTANACTGPSVIRLRISGPLRNDRCRQSRRTIEMITVASNGDQDRDTLKLVCVPAADEIGGCDPTTLFASTFDRLEKQVFTQSCGVATCHDSESTAADLLLESGAAYSNLVGVSPSNGAADDLGWKRVTPGDPSTSLLYHKVTNDLTPELGLRMPRPPRRRRLDPSLQEIIRRWIEAGAPAAGWVPGTD